MRSKSQIDCARLVCRVHDPDLNELLVDVRDDWKMWFFRLKREHIDPHIATANLPIIVQGKRLCLECFGSICYYNETRTVSPTGELLSIEYHDPGMLVSVECFKYALEYHVKCVLQLIRVPDLTRDAVEEDLIANPDTLEQKKIICKLCSPINFFEFV